MQRFRYLAPLGMRQSIPLRGHEAASTVAPFIPLQERCLALTIERRRRGGPNTADQIATGLRGNGLHDPRQGGIHEPRPVGEGPRRLRHHRGRRAAGAPEARRHHRRRHRRQYRHRPHRAGQRAGLPHRHRHPRHPGAGEEGHAPLARRRGRRGAGGALSQPQQLREVFRTPRRFARQERDGGRDLGQPVRQHGQPRHPHDDDGGGDLGRHERQGRWLRRRGRLGRHARPASRAD